jgi:aminopeptidase
VAAPLIREVFRESVRAGAHIETRIGIEGLREILLKEGNDEQLSYLSPIFPATLEHSTALLQLLSDENTKSLTGAKPERIALSRRTMAPINEIINQRTLEGTFRWCVTLFPTNAYAQDAGLSLGDYEEFVFGAGLLDQADVPAAWRAVQTKQQHIIDFLSQHDEIHIVAPGTDITYCVGGRKWINADGRVNFPDGEVFTGPIENSVNGTVRFTYPAIYGGNEVEGVQLTFREGKVVEASAVRGQDFLMGMLDMDEGSRTLGEVAFGLNYGIQRFTRNILFDEKIGGTMHMALGDAYPETGATNHSGLHWDMICDLREGKVYADGQLCYEAGQFKI